MNPRFWNRIYSVELLIIPDTAFSLAPWVPKFLTKGSLFHLQEASLSSLGRWERTRVFGSISWVRKESRLARQSWKETGILLHPINSQESFYTWSGCVLRVHMERGLLAVIKGRWPEGGLASRAWELSLGQNECLQTVDSPTALPSSPSTSLGHQADVSRHKLLRPPLFCHLGDVRSILWANNRVIPAQDLLGSGRTGWGKTWLPSKSRDLPTASPVSLSNPQWVCQPWLSHSWWSYLCFHPVAPFQANEFFRVFNVLYTIAFLY